MKTNSNPQHLTMSKKAGFIIFLIVALPLIPAFYPALRSEIFSPSPEWYEAVSLKIVIASSILSLCSLPVFYHMTRHITGAFKRWSIIFSGPFLIIGLVVAFFIRSLPITLVVLDEKPISYFVKVEGTERRGKSKCSYPFSIEKIYSTFCAETSEGYAQLRRGTKLELYGKGNNVGMFIEGYRIIK